MPETMIQAAEHTGGRARTWRVGTLQYNSAELGKVFFWLLWGDFCLTLMDGGVATSAVSLQLKKLGASNTVIGLLNGTVIALLSALLVSVISTTSDRTRTPLGRRMPYLLWSAPPIALLLTLLGFSSQLGRLLQERLPGFASRLGRLSATLLPGVGKLPAEAALVIAVMTSFLVLYRLIDLFPQSIYYCLWTDVIPQKLMGTFACLFRVVAALGMFIFERFLLGVADRSPQLICLFAAGLYLFSFVAMSLIVKEGNYPVIEPSPTELRRTITLGSIGRYLSECYTDSYYWKYYGMNACFIIAIKSLQQFLLFFGTVGMGLSPQRYGQIVSWRNLVAIIPFLIMGPIADRYHPLRAGIGAGVIVMIAGFGCFFLIHNEKSFEWMVISVFAAIAVYQAATGAIGPTLLPRDKYGQFSSANAVIWQIGWAISSVVCGLFLDRVTAFNPQTGVTLHPENYRYLFLWFAVLVTAGLYLAIQLHRHWKLQTSDSAHGGLCDIAGTM